MKNRITMLMLAFLAVFAFAAPVVAAPPADVGTEESGSDDAAPAPADLPADTEGDTEGAVPADTEGDTEGDTDGAAAPDEPLEIDSDEEAVESLKALYEAIQQNQWGLVVALALALLIYGLRRFDLLSKVPEMMVPWVMAGVGIVGYVAAALAAPGASWLDAITGGFLTGAAAAGLWEMVFKQFLLPDEDFEDDDEDEAFPEGEDASEDEDEDASEDEEKSE